MPTATLDEVLAIAAFHSGLRRVTPEMALDQDLTITGDDVSEFIEALAPRFGSNLHHWPWQRFAELSEPNTFTGFWLIWRLLTWPLRGRVSDPSPFERLEMRHIAACIDAGRWIEP